jgi:uncharacterized protein YbcI/CheY-like chemotaxis protein
VMPDMDGCGLATRFRQLPGFAQTRIVAITGQKDDERKLSALKAGCDAVLFKPVSLKDVKAVLASVVVSGAAQTPKPATARVSPGAEPRLPIEEARRLRKERPSKALSQAESAAAVCDGIIRFQEEYLGWKSEQIRTHFIKELLVVRILGVLTLAERQLGKSMAPEKGRDLIKQVRKQLLELARPMLESLIHEVIGVKVLSMHHDISTMTGEEIVVFSMSEVPRFD